MNFDLTRAYVIGNKEIRPAKWPSSVRHQRRRRGRLMVSRRTNSPKIAHFSKTGEHKCFSAFISSFKRRFENGAHNVTVGFRSTLPPVWCLQM